MHVSAAAAGRRARTAVALPAAHILAASLALGLALSLAVKIPAVPAVPAGLAGLAGIALAALALVDGRRRLPLLAAAVLVAGWWWGTARLESIDRSVLVPLVGSTVRTTLEVTGPARTSRFTSRVPVRVRTFEGRSVREPAQLELPASERAPPQGALLETVAEVKLPRPAEGPGSFDEATYLGRRGVHAVLRASSYRLVGRRGGFAGAADRIRAWLSGSIAPGLSGERRGLVEGIVLGEDEELGQGLKDRFRASGLYHILAVSGQNVAYVVAGILIAAWLAGVPRLAAQLLALSAIVCYVMAVGWQPSVVRAGIAGALTSLAWLAARARDRWYALLVGAIVLLGWTPYSLLDPGFQLSFAAVVAIFLVVPRLERLLEGYPVPRRLAAVVALSAACGAVTAPILWLQFGSVPVLSVLANALGEPVVAPILGLGLAAAAVGAILPSAALAIAWVNGWLAAYLAGCARLVGGLPFARVGSWPVLVGLALAAAAVVVVVRTPAGRRGPLIAAVAAVAVVPVGWKLWSRAPPAAPPDGLRISFLDVGQGDAALLQVPQGAVLVDEGPPEADVAARLRRLGVRRLAAIVLTHPQRDHIGGAADVLRQEEVGEVLDPRQPASSPFETAALAAARARGVPVVAARAGEGFRLGRLRLAVLWPDGPGPPGEDPNQHAVVLLASYGTVDALLTADAESDVTGALRLPPVEILKVAHHGSADAGLPDLLRRITPEVAVISVGAHNDYGHPAPSTVAALAGQPGLRLLRADRDGTVVVESDGSGLVVRSER